MSIKSLKCDDFSKTYSLRALVYPLKVSKLIKPAYLGRTYLNYYMLISQKY